MANAAYKSENSLVQTIVLFVIFFAMFLGGLFALSFWSLESFGHAFIPGAIAMVLCTLAFLIPMTWIGRSNSAGE